MYKSIDCNSLRELKDLSRLLETDLVLLIGIILLANEGLGRVAISKRVLTGERVVRRVIDYLFKDKGRKYMNNLYSFNVRELPVDWLKCEPVLYIGFEQEIIEMVKYNIVAFRDYIVINSRDPRKIEVIGVIQGGALIFPGVPLDISGPYNELSRFVKPGDNGIIICWNKYNKALDNAILLTSIISLCSSN
ncbi:MAG: hypothetical protein QXE81_02715 [Desulfurococcaceae archaeon]